MSNTFDVDFQPFLFDNCYWNKWIFCLRVNIWIRVKGIILREKYSCVQIFL